MTKIPSELGLPSKFDELRPQQEAVLDKFMSSKGNLLVEAPPGVGKTVVAAMLPRLLNTTVTYITPNKSLQKQVCDEIPFARMMMGRSNYPCLLHRGETAEGCEHTTGNPCPFVDQCTYMIAKAEVATAELAVLNSSYYLYASNYAKQFRRDILVVDEADQLENSLTSFVKVELVASNIAKMKQAGISVPDPSFSIEDWMKWAADSKLGIDLLADDAKELEHFDEAEGWRRLSSKLEFMLTNVDDTWFTEYDDVREAIAFRPVTVAKYAQELVWSHHKRVLAMSGTILKPKIVGGDIGFKSSYLAVDNDWPVENRPMYDMTKYVGRLNASNINDKIPTLAMLIDRICSAYQDTKILVHCQSYTLTRKLWEALPNRRFVMNSSSSNRQDVLETFLTTTEAQVLLSPSFVRGLDLAGSDYGCVIIVKAPFANLGSEAVSRRMKMPGGQEWYIRDACASLTQMAFRALRFRTDKCDIYILDEACLRLISQCADWFKKGLQPYQ